MRLLCVDVTLVTEFHEVEGRFTFEEPKGKEDIYPIIYSVWKETAAKVLDLHREKVSVLGIVFDTDHIGNYEKARLAFWKFFAATKGQGVNVSWRINATPVSHQEGGADHG